MDGCGVPRLSESCGGISPVIGGTSTLERPENHPLPPHIQLPDSLAPCYRADARALPDSHGLGGQAHLLKTTKYLDLFQNTWAFIDQHITAPLVLSASQHRSLFLTSPSPPLCPSRPLSLTLPFRTSKRDHISGLHSSIKDAGHHHQDRCSTSCISQRRGSAHGFHLGQRPPRPSSKSSGLLGLLLILRPS